MIVTRHYVWWMQMVFELFLTKIFQQGLNQLCSVQTSIVVNLDDFLAQQSSSLRPYLTPQMHLSIKVNVLSDISLLFTSIRTKFSVHQSVLKKFKCLNQTIRNKIDDIICSVAEQLMKQFIRLTSTYAVCSMLCLFLPPSHHFLLGWCVAYAT